jgi:hypothetical protein
MKIDIDASIAVRFLTFHFIKKKGEASRAGPLPGPRPSSPAGRQALASWLGLDGSVGQRTEVGKE